MSPRPAAGLALLLLLGTAFARELGQPSVTQRQLLGEKDHKFKTDEAVPLWASKVGPFANPRYRSVASACWLAPRAAR
jgi:hypothetical protein